MSEVSQTVARSIGEAAGTAARLVAQAVDHAVTELQCAESHTPPEQRQLVADAWHELLARRKDWVDRFPTLLRGACEQAARNDALAATASGADAPSSGFLSLTLVDDTEIARKIESARLAQQLTSMLERPLAELDALMSSALGLAVIQPERNPLRPAVYARALRELMDAGKPDPAWPALWLRHMVQPLAHDLEQVYREQARLLTDAQVHAADYRLVTVPSKGPAPVRPAGVASAGGGGNGVSSGGNGNGHGPVQEPAPAAPAPAAPAARMAVVAPAERPASSQATHNSGFMELPQLPPQAVDGLRLRLFLARDDPQAHQPVAASFRAQAEAELRAIEERIDTRGYDDQAAREHMHLPVVDRPPRPVDTDTPLRQSVWGDLGAARERALVRGRLKAQARELGQVFGLEVVRRLINKVAEDPRLLTPVREAIVALEPSLSRLAMVAPRFFSDEAHPGRLLVERVADRSFKYNDEFSVEFQAFLVPVAQTFTRLNEIERFDNAIPFQAALAALQAGWRAQDELDEQAQRKVLEAVQFAERRQQEAQRIASELRQREDLAATPAEVRDFLLSTWAVVIAHARLTQPTGGIDPGGHLALVTDLLWSVNCDLTLHDPARAFVLLPRLLLKLREGLAALGQQPAESEAFFHQLEQLHRPVLKLRAKHRHRELAPSEPSRSEAVAPPARPEDQPWMAEDLLRAAGFEQAPPSDFGALPPAQQPTRRPEEPLDDHAIERVLAKLAPGCWVDLFSHRQWRRARLVWAAERGTLFMFVGNGGEAHSMSRRILQRLVRDHLLRTLESEGVVPRALERLGEPSAPLPLAA
jgi:hypothetical protein